MPTRAPLMCRVWGHRIDPDASYYYGVEYCDRCVESVNDVGPREWLRAQWWALRYRVHEAIAPHLNYFKKCPDCGHRFNKCDDTVDHLPF